MGCGQSKKIHLYPRKNKSKSNGKKDDTEDDEEHIEGREKNEQHQREKIDDDLHQLSERNSPEPNSNDIIIPILKKNGPILQSQDISSSQQNFFKMLDQKIEQGADYDSSSETEVAVEEARQAMLVHHWESASLSASSTSRSQQSTPVRNEMVQQSTPVRQTPHRQPQVRSQFQQPLSAELLSQQQQMIKQLQLHQAGGLSINSPKRVELNPNNRQQNLLTQTIIHQTYGVQPQPPLPQAHILAQYQNQQQSNLGSNMQLRQLSASSVIPSNYSPPIPGAANIVNSNRNACLQMSYYSQPSNFGEQVQQPEPRFPPAISVNRLTPQVQRQLRETQELIKDCTPLYGAYQPAINPPSSSNPQNQIRSQTRTGLRRPLETQYSQELS